MALPGCHHKRPPLEASVGNLHGTRRRPGPMEPPKWSDENAAPDLSGSVAPQGVAMTDPYQAQGQMIFVQPPSGAAKVMGILIIINSSFGVLIGLGLLLGGSFIESLLGAAAQQDSTLTTPQIEGYGQFITINGLLQILIAGVTLLAGVWMMQYQKRGVHLALLAIGASFLLDLVMTVLYPEYTTQGTRGGFTVVLISGVVANGFCGLMVAIPLMVSNNGLDDSSLFPSKAQ